VEESALQESFRERGYALTTRIHTLDLPLERDPASGWKAHSLFAGTTPNVRAMRCHASVLDPGRQPHHPHRHHEEELLLILDGEADLVLDDPAHAEGTVRRRVQRGTFAYYPANFAHTIHNISGAPVTYVMFKWTGGRKEQGDLLEHRLVPFAESVAEMRHDDPSGFTRKRVLHGATGYLRLLHSHISTLAPGAGYDAHVDAHDVAIVVLEGTVETLGQSVGPHGVIFYAAGESHGMRNMGDGPATYVVFEFHGRHARGRPGPERRLTRRLWRLARNPRALARAVRRRLAPG
jgi:mannose-6-phosphate isomerase-like protein (cupin superfamily)